MTRVYAEQSTILASGAEHPVFYTQGELGLLMADALVVAGLLTRVEDPKLIARAPPSARLFSITDAGRRAHAFLQAKLAEPRVVVSLKIRQDGKSWVVERDGVQVGEAQPSLDDAARVLSGLEAAETEAGRDADIDYGVEGLQRKAIASFELPA